MKEKAQTKTQQNPDSNTPTTEVENPPKIKSAPQDYSHPVVCSLLLEHTDNKALRELIADVIRW